jgi:hypothetical protein
MHLMITFKVVFVTMKYFAKIENTGHDMFPQSHKQKHAIMHHTTNQQHRTHYQH